MSKEEFSPIASWLSGTQLPTVFGGGSFRFQVRKEMSTKLGRLQAGMFAVFTLESISNIFQDEDFAMDQCDLEVFDVPPFGDWITVHTEKKRNSFHSTIFDEANNLLARVIIA